MPLSGDECRRLIDAAHARAGQIGIRVTVAVVDEGGLLLALARMDGAPPISAQIAEGKACGAALWHRDGASLAQVAQDRPAFFEAVGRMVRVPIMPGLGSALIRRRDAVLGAVGVSGAKSEQDLDCAEAGLRAIARRRPDGGTAPLPYFAAAARCSLAAATPPARCGIPASASPISTPASAPQSMRSLNAPRWPIRKSLPFSLPRPWPKDMSKRSRMR